MIPLQLLLLLVHQEGAPLSRCTALLIPLLLLLPLRLILIPLLLLLLQQLEMLQWLN